MKKVIIISLLFISISSHLHGMEEGADLVAGDFANMEAGNPTADETEMLAQFCVRYGLCRNHEKEEYSTGLKNLRAASPESFDELYADFQKKAGLTKSGEPRKKGPVRVRGKEEFSGRMYKLIVLHGVKKELDKTRLELTEAQNKNALSAQLIGEKEVANAQLKAENERLKNQLKQRKRRFFKVSCC